MKSFTSWFFKATHWATQVIINTLYSTNSVKPIRRTNAGRHVNIPNRVIANRTHELTLRHFGYNPSNLVQLTSDNTR